MGRLWAHLVTAMLSMYYSSLWDAIADPMAAPYISALYDLCGPTTRARMRRGPFVTVAPAAWYSEPAISTIWRPPSEYRDVPSGYF